MRNYPKSFLYAIKWILLGNYILFTYACTNARQDDEQRSIPTDSSGIHSQVSERLPLTATDYFLEGTWIKLSDSSRWIFKGRKLYTKKQHQELQTVFARYNSPPSVGGYYDSLGSFLVVGSGADSLVCYKIVQLNTDSLIINQENTTRLLTFSRVD